MILILKLHRALTRALVVCGAVALVSGCGTFFAPNSIKTEADYESPGAGYPNRWQRQSMAKSADPEPRFGDYKCTKTAEMIECVKLNK